MTKKTQPRVRRYFSDEFKKDAVAMIGDDRTVTSVARELGLARSLLRRWKDQIEGNVTAPGSGMPAMSEQAEEIRRLRKELKEVTESRDILKKALVFFADEKK
jgi:transposase